VINSFQKVANAPEIQVFIQQDEEELSQAAIVAVAAAQSVEGSADAIMDFASVIRNDFIFVNAREIARDQVIQAYDAVSEFVTNFTTYVKTYNKNKEEVVDISLLFSTGDIDCFLQVIQMYNAQVKQFDNMATLTEVGMYLVDSCDMRKEMMPSAQDCLAAIGNYIPTLVQNKIHSLQDILGTMNPILSSDPTSIEAYVHKKATKDKASLELDDFRGQQAYVRSLIQILDENKWAVSDDIKANVRMLKESLIQLEHNIQLSESREEDEVKRFTNQVVDECPKLTKKIIDIQVQLDAQFIGDPDASEDKVLKFLQQQESLFTKYKARAERLQEYQTVLKMPIDDFEAFDAIGADLAIKMRLWKDRLAWSMMKQNLMDSSIKDLDIPTMEKEMTKFNKTVFLCEKALPGNKAVSRFKESVEQFNPVLPIVTDLRNTALKVIY
jgi:hypothetical protein